MNEEKWIAWKMQTSKNWEDMADVLLYTNIDFIDYDHKVLVEYALKLNRIINKSEEEFTLEILHEISELLQKLYDYAVEHFDREEAFMEKYSLPEIEAHKREHSKILKMLRSALDDFAKGKVKVSHKLKTQVMDWLIGHINITDYKFFDIHNWSKNLVDASDWNEVRDIIKLTGISEIDKQHKSLTEKAIHLMIVVSATKDQELIGREFDEFRKYVEYHFDYETKFMDLYEIKETKDHLDKHDYFVRRLKEFPKEIALHTRGVDDLKVWILTWWINHINITDKDTFDYNNWAYQAIERAEKIEDISEVLRLTHVSSVDSDHLQLMRVTLELNQMISDYAQDNVHLDTPHIKEEVTALFKEIYHIAEKHFAREEVIMKRHHLVDTVSHTNEHNDILKRISLMLSNYEQERLYVSNNVKTMILDWWIHHTNNIDYRTFVANLDVDLAKQIIEEEKVYEKL